MLFICRIKTLEKTNTKTFKNNENKQFDDFFQSSNQDNKINKLKYAWLSQWINKRLENSTNSIHHQVLKK